MQIHINTAVSYTHLDVYKRQDLMINLFPAAFFSKLVFRIVMMFAIGFIGCFVGAYIYLRYQLKHYQAETQELSHDA